MSFPGDGRKLGTGSSALGKQSFVKYEKLKAGNSSTANPIVIAQDDDENDDAEVCAEQPSACDGDAELARRLQAEERKSSDSLTNANFGRHDYDYEDDSDEEDAPYGFTHADQMTLQTYGLKPWDDGADEVIAIIRSDEKRERMRQKGLRETEAARRAEGNPAQQRFGRRGPEL
jgi:hypothetical protein